MNLIKMKIKIYISKMGPQLSPELVNEVNEDIIISYQYTSYQYTSSCNSNSIKAFISLMN